MSICVTESAYSRHLLDEQHRRESAQERAEADMVFCFMKALELGDPDFSPGWAKFTRDYDAAKRLGMRLDDPGYPYRRMTVSDLLEDGMGYVSAGDLVKVLAITMKCSDPVAALAARQFAERVAGKYAEHNVEVSR